MKEHDNSKRAPERKPYRLTQSEVESLRRDARKMDKVAKAYFAVKTEEELEEALKRLPHAIRKDPAGWCLIVALALLIVVMLAKPTRSHSWLDADCCSERNCEPVSSTRLASGSAERSHATTDRADRLRRSSKRLGYDLVDAERRGFYIRREGSKVNETADPVRVDLAGVEAWIRDNAPKKRA